MSTGNRNGNGNGKTKYRVMQPVKLDGREETFWNRVGTAFLNPANGEKKASIKVMLSSIPLSGELVLFEDDGSTRQETDASRGPDAPF